MRIAWTRWAVLAWVTLWLVVIAPGHQRGMIRTDSAEKEGNHACCAVRKSGETDHPSDQKKSPKSDPARHCALCYLNATLDLPITIDLTLRLSGLLERVRPAGAETIVALELNLPFSGRAPPAMSCA